MQLGKGPLWLFNKQRILNRIVDAEYPENVQKLKGNSTQKII